MKLPEYIKTVGDAKAKELFGVEMRTIESWRRGERRPRLNTAILISKVTNGVVKLEECY